MQHNDYYVYIHRRKDTGEVSMLVMEEKGGPLLEEIVRQKIGCQWWKILAGTL